MIKVKGRATLEVDYCIEMDLTEEEFEKMDSDELDDRMESLIDWQEACRDATVTNFDVFDYYEVKKNSND